MDTENINIQFIKSKLNKYGISFENFQLQTGNLVGKVIVPSALRAFNRNLTAEQAFYFVANKVFESANLLAFGIPAKLEDCYDRVVSHEDFKDFQKAIYEEINQRFISNTFPEFANAGNVSLSNISIQNGYMGGQYIQDWVNPVSRQIISNIDWRQYDEAADVERDKVYMYRNMHNAWLPLSESKRFILALEDGSVGYTDINEFATSKNLELAGEQIKQNYDQQVQNKTDINILKEETKKLASLDYVNNIALAFPKTEEWNPDKIYNRPQFVVYAGCIYWNLVDNNINKVPGGITGEGYWIKVRDLFVATNVNSIIYAPGTDIKYSISNPNNLYYVSIEDILKIPELSLNTLFTYLDNNYPHLNLTIENVQDFFNNLCNSDVANLTKTFGKQLKFSRDQIILFDDEVSMINFINSNHLATNDYSKINYGDYLKFSKSTQNTKRGGNNLLSRQNLPNLSSTIEWYTRCDNWNPINSGNDLMRFSLHENGSRHDGDKGGGKSAKIEFKLNPNQQTEFEPKYYTIFSIKINRDIYYETSIKSWTNIVKMSLEGKLIKTEDGNEEIDNTGLNKVYYKNKKETTDGVVHELYDQDKTIFAVPDISYNINLKNWVQSKINELSNVIDKNNQDLSSYAKLDDPNQNINLNNLYATMTYSYSLAFQTSKNDDNPLGIANLGITTDNKGEQLLLTQYNGDLYLPTDDNSLVNKSYVDNQIANIAQPDLSNCAKLNESNDFSSWNTFTDLEIVGYQGDDNSGALYFSPPREAGFDPYPTTTMRLNFQKNTRTKIRCIDLFSGHKDEDMYNYQQSEFAIIRFKDLKDYVENNIPQPQEINLVEGVETAIQNYKINGKQVYRAYCVSDQQIKNIISIADYISISGLAQLPDGYYKGVPWTYDHSQIYSIDAQSSGGLANNGFNTTGHKIVCEYTKK